MRKTVAIAFFLLFPVIAAAQITITPATITYNTEGAILTIAGTGLAGNIATTVDFTNRDGGVAEVTALTATSTEVTAEVPLSVTDLPGAWAVTVNAIDDTGVRVNGGATLTITANLPPLITVPEVVTAEATSASGANVTYFVDGFSFVDPPPAPSIACNHPSGSLFPLGSTSVTCTATDSFGSTSASFTVLVVDTTPPVITVPASFISQTNVVTYTVSATDAVDGTVPVSCSPASGSTFPNGITTVMCSASDAHDNFGFASFQVSVLTPPAPILTLPGNITVYTDDPGITVAFDVSADQGATAVCTPESASFFPLGTTTVSCTATNVFGVSSTGSFTVTVAPDPRPTLILPADFTVDPAGTSGTVVTYTATATDTVDGTIPVTCTPPSGSTFPIGTNLVQCSATNSRGYTRFGQFYIYVRDSTPPVLTLPSNISVPSAGAGGTVVTYTATAHDAVEGDLPVDCSPASGSLFDDGTTVVQCTASDSSGNVAFGSFNVTVGDTVPPVITVPGNITAEATSASGAVVTYTVSAVDAVDGPVDVVCSPLSGSTFALGTTTVTCSAHDLAGNIATATFTVTVQDTTPPQVLSISASPRTIIWPPNHKLIDTTITVVAVDAVDPSPTSTIVSVSSDQPIDGTGDGDTAPDWVITGPLTVQLRAERSYGFDRTYTITVVTTDFSGNTTTSTVQVKVALQ
jgi:hypothetical protein